MRLLVHMVRLLLRLLALSHQHWTHHCGSLSGQHLLLGIGGQSQRFLVL